MLDGIPRGSAFLLVGINPFRLSCNMAELCQYQVLSFLLRFILDEYSSSSSFAVLVVDANYGSDYGTMLSFFLTYVGKTRMVCTLNSYVFILVS